jgi:hypothetical protein
MAVGLIVLMAFFMNSLTDTILLETLQPMAKTAAQNIEGNLHTLAERFFMLRDKEPITSSDSTVDEKRQVLNDIVSGVEFTWVGLYLPNGDRLAGTGESPGDISGRRLFAAIKGTDNLVIEDTSIGHRGAEITMGLPVSLTGTAEAERAYYLVGGYDYEMIGDILRKINVSPNGIAFIVNGEGRSNGFLVAEHEEPFRQSVQVPLDVLGGCLCHGLEGLKQDGVGQGVHEKRHKHDEAYGHGAVNQDGDEVDSGSEAGRRP